MVILVDEYDKPLLQAIGDTELQDAYRATLKGFYADIESHTDKGRMDMTVKTAQEALDQIDQNGYAGRFASDCRTIIKVGVNYSTAARNIDSWVV